MADYYGVTKTNLFKVKDEQAFRGIMSKVHADGDIEVSDCERGKEKYFAFCCNGVILGFPIEQVEDCVIYEDDCEFDYDSMSRALQTVVAEDDVIIITEVGHVKLTELVGNSCIITSNQIKGIDLNNVAIKLAGEMLGNNKFCDKF